MPIVACCTEVGLASVLAMDNQTSRSGDLNHSVRQTLFQMSTNRIAAVALSVVLVALLSWSILAGVGDIRTRIILGVGVLLGLLYAAIGHVPDWIVDYSGGSITNDDDPSNISPRVYLPILLGVVVVAVTTFVVVVFLF